MLPPLGGSFGGLPSRLEYLSPQKVLLPRLYSTTASPLWLELRGRAAWQVGYVPARLPSVVAMAPGDVCHGPRCSLAELGRTALGYRPYCGPSGPAGSPQCVRPVGCGLLLPVPYLPWACLSVRCPWPLGARSPVCVPDVSCVSCVRCPWPLGGGSQVRALCVLCVWCWWYRWGFPPFLFLSYLFFPWLLVSFFFLVFLKNVEERTKDFVVISVPTIL